MMKACMWLAGVLIALSAACNKAETVPATQVLVRVASELGPEVTSVDAQLYDEREQIAGQSTTIAKTPPFSFAIVPAAKLPARSNLIVLTAKNAAGDVLAVVKAVVSFVDQKTVLIELRFTQACRGKPCGPGLACAASVSGAGECVAVPVVRGAEISPVTEEGSEFTVMIGDDGGTAPVLDAGNTDGGGNPEADSGQGMTDAAVGMLDASNGVDSAGGPPGGDADSAVGGADGGMQTIPDCDGTRACSAGYICNGGKCVSLCEQTRCDPNATCALMGSTPVCSCGNGFISKTDGTGAVTCLADVQCSELRCDPNATCDIGADQLRHCTCKLGYTGSGTTCAPINCGPLTVQNGSVQTNGGTFEETAVYTCDAGYTKTGGTTRKCEVGGWSGTAPTCEPYDCRTPPAPAHGKVSVTNGTKYPNGTVRYSCDPGFSLSGTNSDTRTCTPSGWSGAAPTCLGCGDGIVSVSLFEECELGPFSNPWECIKCKKPKGAYTSCANNNGICPSGLSCHSGGYCTVAPCSNDVQCPATPPGNPVTSSCQGGGFGCTLTGCTSSTQCPPGLRCDSTSGFCIL